MCVFVAKRIVTVALISMAAPALASSGTFSQKPTLTVNTSMQASTAITKGQAYWSGSSEYYYSDQAGTSRISADPRHPARRILITGYHPVEGFEGEIAKEAENMARYSR